MIIFGKPLFLSMLMKVGGFQKFEKSDFCAFSKNIFIVSAVLHKYDRIFQKKKFHELIYEKTCLGKYGS